MSLIWSLIIGFVLYYYTKIGWIFIICVILGPIIYNSLRSDFIRERKREDQYLFLFVLFEMLGHMSKAKGVVTADDIHLASHLMDQFQLDEERRKLAQSSFKRGKAANYPLRGRLKSLYLRFRSRRDVLNLFCEQLIQAALVDGKLDEKEQRILFIIANEFDISQQQMENYIQMMVGSYHFRQQGGYQYYSQSSYSQSSNRSQNSHSQNGHSHNSRYNQSYRSSGGDLKNAYRILGVTETTEVITIKRAYRKLMNEHHPDKLASKGLPKEMLESAKKRAQEIQIAYELIKVSRGFK
ncbi:co-chaperone DjlA [Orbaceae bacterium ESL0721]|nr:co-chaperone DjlA [Orbaceae bacterium ESL0721]